MSYPSYLEYKNLNNDWNKSAPKHWLESKLKYDSYIKARVGWHGLKSDDFTDEGPYLVTGSDFLGKIVNWNKCYHCDVERYEQDPYIKLKDDDLLITKDGTIGKVILVGELPGPATLNSGLFVLRPLNSQYLTKFYYWLMQSSIFHGFVEYYRTGSTILHLYQETFCNLPYALPPIEEQQKIADFLDKETAKIDTLIEKQKRLIQLLEEKRQAVVSFAVTKGLNHDIKTKGCGVECVSEHWIKAKIKYYATKIGSGKTPKGGSEIYKEKGVLFLRSQNIHNRGLKINRSDCVYIDKSIHEEMIGTAVKSGDILLNITGASIGRSCIVPDNFDEANINQHVCIIRCSNRLNNFFSYVMQSDLIQEQIKLNQTGANREGLNFEQIGNMVIYIPSLSEGQKIAAHLQKYLQHHKSLINECRKAILLLEERRISIISAAVTGKIDVRNTA